MNSKTARCLSGRRSEYRLTPLAWQLAGLLMYSGVAQAEYRFSSALLQIGNTPQTEVDLALFTDEEKQPPGSIALICFSTSSGWILARWPFLCSRTNRAKNVWFLV